MRAVVLRGGRLEVRETPDPVAGPGELLLRTLSTAICASDASTDTSRPCGTVLRRNAPCSIPGSTMSST